MVPFRFMPLGKDLTPSVTPISALVSTPLPRLHYGTYLRNKGILSPWHSRTYRKPYFYRGITVQLVVSTYRIIRPFTTNNKKIALATPHSLLNLFFFFLLLVDGPWCVPVIGSYVQHIAAGCTRKTGCTVLQYSRELLARTSATVRTLSGSREELHETNDKLRPVGRRGGGHCRNEKHAHVLGMCSDHDPPPVEENCRVHMRKAIYYYE